MVNYLQRIGKVSTGYFRRKSKKIFELIFKLLPIYWTDFNRIPLIKWWKAQSGDYGQLVKVKLPFNLSFLQDIYMKHVYQMENLDLSKYRKIAEAQLLMSQSVVTGDKMLEFEAKLIEKELELDKKEDVETSLNKFIDYIELSLNCIGTINPERTSAGRAYSLHHRAKEKNKELAKKQKKNVNN